MTVRLIQQHDTAFLRGASWEINGEYVVLAKEAGAEVLLTVASARTRAWAEAASTLIESLASSRGVLARIEGGIDTRFVVVPRHEVAPLLELAAAQRFGTADYEALTRGDAQRALLARLVTAGGTLPRDALDESVEVAHFPLGYHLRDAIVDLRAAGAIQLRPVDGGSISITDVGRDALARHVGRD